MTPRRFALAWLATLLVFLPIDAVWLTLAGPRLYTPALGHLLAPQPDLAAAAVFYALYLAGLVVFTVRPDDLSEPWPRSAAQWGHLAITGVLMHAGYLGGVWAAVKAGMGAGLSALIVGLQPVLTAMWLSATGARVTTRQWAGLGLGFAGGPPTCGAR